MKKIIILLVILGILTAIFIIFFNKPSKSLTASEKEQALTNILGRKPVIGDANEPKGNTEYKGHFVSFLYPARAKVYILKVNGEVKKDNWNLDSLSFDLSDPRVSVLVTVSQAQNGVLSLDDYPSVKLRQIQPGLYHGKEIVINNHKGLEFDKNDQQIVEKTAFFYISSKIYVFSITGADKEGIEELFNQIMSSVKFLP